MSSTRLARAIRAAHARLAAPIHVNTPRLRSTARNVTATIAVATTTRPLLPRTGLASLAGLACAMLLPLDAAHAQRAGNAPTIAEKSVNLEPVVVTATRTPETLDRLIADVTAVDLIPGASGLALTDLLGASGAQLATNGGPGATTGLFLRGANTGHTLTLIDGFRIGSASLGQTTFEALPLDYADRVEILRGPASSLYGADAIGGVIQLLTRDLATGLQGHASAAIGQEATRQLRAGLEGGDDRIRARVRVGQDRSDGFDATTPGYFGHHPDRDGYRRDAVSAQLEARLTADTQLKATALSNRLTADFDDGSFDGARVKTRNELLGLTLIHAPDALSTIEAKVGQTRDRSESLSSYPGVINTTMTQIGLTGSRTLVPGVVARLVLERLQEQVDADGYSGGRATRDTNAIGLVLTGDEGPHRLQAGVRLDDNSQYGHQTHFNIAYGYRLGGGLRVGASHATAFHAPSFNDLYFPGYGRTGIKPETARNSEAGFWWNPPAASTGGMGQGRWHGRLVAFQSQVKDLIVYAPVCPDPDPQYVYGCADNVERARIRGVSLTVGRQAAGEGASARRKDSPLATDRPTGLSWSVHVDLLDPENTSTGNRLARRATRQLTAVIDHGQGDWRVGIDLIAAGSRFDDNANQNPLGGYAVINLRAAYRVAPDLELFGSIANLADRDYATAQYYRRQGRLMLAGVRYALR